MKKLLICAFAVCVSVCLAACGGNGGNTDNSGSAGTTPSTPSEVTSPATSGEPATSASPALFYSAADYGTYQIATLGGTIATSKFDEDILALTVQRMREEQSFLTVVLSDSPQIIFQGAEYPLEFTWNGENWTIAKDPEIFELFGKEVFFSLEDGNLRIWDADLEQDYTFRKDL